MTKADDYRLTETHPAGDHELSESPPCLGHDHHQHNHHDDDEHQWQDNEFDQHQDNHKTEHNGPTDRIISLNELVIEQQQQQQTTPAKAQVEAQALALASQEMTTYDANLVNYLDACKLSHNHQDQNRTDSGHHHNRENDKISSHLSSSVKNYDDEKHTTTTKSSKEDDIENNGDRQIEAKSSRQIDMSQRGQVYVWLDSVPCVGIAITLLSSILFGCSMALVKKGLQLQPGISGIQMTFSRSVVMAVITGLLCAYKGLSLKIQRGERMVNIARAVFGGIACIGLYTSMKFISVADASAISFSSPVWTCIMSYIVFKEPLMAMQLISLPASLLGMLIIARPQWFAFVGLADGLDSSNQFDIVDDQRTLLSNTTLKLTNASWPPSPDLMASLHQQYHVPQTDLTPIGDDSIISELEQEIDTQTYGSDDRIYGILLALGSSFLMAIVYIVLKFRKTTPVQVTVFWLSAFCVVVAMFLMLTSGRYEWPQGLEVWACVIGNGIFSWLGQTVFQEAFLFEDAGIISLVRTSDVVVTYALSFFLLHEDIRLSSVVGAMVITLSVISLMANKWLRFKHSLAAAPTVTDAKDKQQVDEKKSVNKLTISGNKVIDCKPPMEHTKCNR